MATDITILGQTSVIVYSRKLNTLYEKNNFDRYHFDKRALYRL